MYGSAGKPCLPADFHFAVVFRTTMLQITCYSHQKTIYLKIKIVEMLYFSSISVGDAKSKKIRLQPVSSGNIF